MPVERASALVVTYCCRDKHPAPELLPARDRYLSPRIGAAGEAAARLGFDFRILSGLYGLVEPGRLIPDYDHLLEAGQVPDQAEKVAGQLAQAGGDRVIFVTRPLAEDPATEPYRRVMETACSALGLAMEIVELEPGDPSVEDLLAGMWGPGRR